MRQIGTAFVAATVTTVFFPVSTGAAEPERSAASDLTEIVVTAEKRSARLQDVPAAVSALSADSLLEQQSFSLRDYYSRVPGLGILDSGNGRVRIAIRGLSTGSGNPTVGITIDDVPYGATATGLINGPGFTPQLDPADLERIEVLRGPQGTLYGATSIGGLLKYVTAAPSLRTTSGRVQLGGSSVTDGGMGFSVHGAYNTPLIEDTLGVRVSAFSRRDAGFIDDPAQGLSDVNDTDVWGTRGAMLWQMAPNVSLRVAGLFQSTRQKGDGRMNTDFAFRPLQGDLEHADLRGTGDVHHKSELYTANLDMSFERADLVSVTGYGVQRIDEDLMVPVYAPFAQSFFGVSGASLIDSFTTRKFSEEVRLSSHNGSRFEWLLGAFLTHERNDPIHQQVFAVDPATGEHVGRVVSYRFPSTFQEAAAFVNLTYHFTDRLDVQLGTRYGANRQRYDEVDTGPLNGEEDYVISALRSKDDSTTYLLTPRLRLSDTLMLYARVSSGYRAGGPNTVPQNEPGISQTYGPDKTASYEVGFKSQPFDRRLTLNVDAFRVDWSEIQLSQRTPLNITYLTNAGEARSMGVEISTVYAPIDGLTISGNAAYIDAELTSTAGNGFTGVSGDRLPMSSTMSGTLAVEKSFALSGGIDGKLGVSGSYVGARWNDFPSGSDAFRIRFPSYTTLDAQAALMRNGYTLTLIGSNLADKRGVLSTQTFIGSVSTAAAYRTAVIRPRMIGISIAKDFD